ncbi:MAG: DUF1080 domain-containing protein [Cyclobacteriaceae bacterium]|nr:DUF1080 domain-containing protein [Cyclobacteriaceae bacterium]
MKKLLSIFILTCLFGFPVSAQQGKWINLFDGKTLKGWSVHSGFAKYRVEDNAIVGTAVQNSPNSFLCTDKEYGDFILEFEVMVDPKLNSGVQDRSRIAPEELTYWLRNENGELKAMKVPKDRVHGYQVEIAGADVGTSGGIYDEARRAMIPEWWIKKGTEASKAFKDGQWNKYRVECRGQSIKTRVNEVQTANIQDAMTQKGIIGLQVHDVGNDTTPYEVKWRNIRLMELKD